MNKIDKENLKQQLNDAIDTWTDMGIKIWIEQINKASYRQFVLKYKED